MGKERLHLIFASPIVLSVAITHILLHLSLLVPLAAPVSFDLPSFDRETKVTCSSNQRGICLQGDAVLNQGLQITKNHLHTSLASSVGRAVYSQPVHIWDSSTRQMTDFTTQFSFIIYDVDPQSPSGDGLAFFLSSYPSVIPENSAGGFLGLFPNSSHSDRLGKVVAIEFDTYPNDRLDSSSGEHIGINVNSIRSVADFTLQGGIKKRTLAMARVEYSANRQALSVALTYDDASLEGNSSLSHVMDLREVLPEYVSIGFSAATGSMVETHTIFSWSFDSNLDTRGSGTVRLLVLLGTLTIGAILVLLPVWSWRKTVAKRKVEEAVKDATPAGHIEGTGEKQGDTGLDTLLAKKTAHGLRVREDENISLDGITLEKVGGSQEQVISSEFETFTAQEGGQKGEYVSLDRISLEEVGGNQNHVISWNLGTFTRQEAGQKDEFVGLGDAKDEFVSLGDTCLEGVGGSQEQVISSDSGTFSRQGEGQKDEDVSFYCISFEEVGGNQNQAISSGLGAFTRQEAGQRDELVTLGDTSLEWGAGSQNHVINSDWETSTRLEEHEDEDVSLDGILLEEGGGSQNQVINPDSQTFTRQDGRKDEGGGLDTDGLDEDGPQMTESGKTKNIIQLSLQKGGGTNVQDNSPDASTVKGTEGSYIEAPVPIDILDTWSPKEIPYHVLVNATNNFSEEMMLGKGGFGPVYRGFLCDLGLDVAIKKLSERSQQGMSEYMAEVKIITQLRHRNLVKLIAWCHENGELMLVYEFMPNGSLDNHLFKENNLLEWPARYRIALGLANALMYLHDDCEPFVLHRDVKSSNVLLDSKFDAKLSDFGLARLFNLDMSSLRVTHPAGTRGYWAPEYALMLKASRRADVYSFGVVALEIACGKKAILMREGGDGENVAMLLVEWVWELYGKGAILDAADKRLNGNFDLLQMERLLTVGLWCAQPDPRKRPSMRQASNALLFPETTLLPDLPTEVVPWAYPLSSMQVQMVQYSPEPAYSPSTSSTKDDSMSTSQHERQASRGASETLQHMTASEDPTGWRFLQFAWWPTWRFLQFAWWPTKDTAAGFVETLRMITGLREFSYDELVRATENFSSAMKLGGGLSDHLYRGQLGSGMVASVKKFRRSGETMREYMTEVITLRRLEHENLVKLIGWCLDSGRRLLVYGSLANGSLNRHLYGYTARSGTITWEARYRVALGLASALCYLHNDCEQCVLHRNISSSNLWLDEGFNVKLGGFGVARQTDHGVSLSTAVAGVPGYIAPEYFQSSKYTAASDVYSFGVVALEIAWGRMALQPHNTPDSTFLASWAWRCYAFSGILLEASDKKLMGCFDSREMERLMVVGLWCTLCDPTQRPEIGKVLRVLQFQEELPFPAPDGVAGHFQVEDELLPFQVPADYMPVWDDVQTDRDE